MDILDLTPLIKTPFLSHFVTKSGPFGPNPPHKPSFLAHFVAKSGPFGRFGVVRRTPPPGYGPAVVLLQFAF